MFNNFHHFTHFIKQHSKNTKQIFNSSLKNQKIVKTQFFSTNIQKPTKPISIIDLNNKYKNNQKLKMITAYDYNSAFLADKSGVDMILVGDSLGMVVLGHSSTIPVTLEEMTHHCRAVRRGINHAFLIGDLPFGSYLTEENAVKNAFTLIQKGYCSAVKLEGGKKMSHLIKSITKHGISVAGHIGLTPQTATSIGGYRVQGRDAESAFRLYEDAISLQESGCFMIVLECIPSKLAQIITQKLNIPTIGIGAGPNTSGQVQVFHDLFGLYQKFAPKFSKRFVDVGKLIEKGISDYCEEVDQMKFPTKSHSFKMNDEEYKLFLEKISKKDDKNDENKSLSEEDVNKEQINGLDYRYKKDKMKISGNDSKEIKYFVDYK